MIIVRCCVAGSLLFCGAQRFFFDIMKARKIVASSPLRSSQIFKKQDPAKGGWIIDIYLLTSSFRIPPQQIV